MVERAKILFQSLAATGFRNNDDVIIGQRSQARAACAGVMPYYE